MRAVIRLGLAILSMVGGLLEGGLQVLWGGTVVPYRVTVR